MAQILKAGHNLIALKVKADPEMSSALCLVLEDHRRPDTEVAQWNLCTNPEAQTLSEVVASVDAVLTALIPAITDAVRSLHLAGGEPIWLHLVRPYGYCGAANWETILRSALNRPILRLPDFLERSREHPDTLDLALVCDPADAPPDACARLLEDLIAAALKAPRAQIRVNVFTTPAILDRLKPKAGLRIRLHRPRPDRRAEHRGKDVGWLSWIARTMAETALDAVHFLTPADETYGRAALVFSAFQTEAEGDDSSLSLEPGGVGRRETITRVERGELAEFLDKMGAWAVLFTPLGERSLEHRFLADGLGQMRPGPAVMMDRVAEVRQQRLYQFLFAREASSPPLIEEGLIYCQPALVDRSGDLSTLNDNGIWDRLKFEYASPSLRDRALVRVAHFPIFPDIELPATPLWASAAQRYIEQAAMRRNRQARFIERLPAGDDDTVAIDQANTAIDQTLVEIQKVLDEEVFKVEDPS